MHLFADAILGLHLFTGFPAIMNPIVEIATFIVAQQIARKQVFVMYLTVDFCTENPDFCHEFARPANDQSEVPTRKFPSPF